MKIDWQLIVFVIGSLIFLGIFKMDFWSFLWGGVLYGLGSIAKTIQNYYDKM